MAFFVVAAAAAGVLIPAAPEDLRWVAMTVSGMYFVLAVLATLDILSRRHRHGRR